MNTLPKGPPILGVGEAIEYLQGLALNRFSGTLLLKFESGSVLHVEQIIKESHIPQLVGGKDVVH